MNYLSLPKTWVLNPFFPLPDNIAMIYAYPVTIMSKPCASEYAAALALSKEIDHKITPHVNGFLQVEFDRTDAGVVAVGRPTIFILRSAEVGDLSEKRLREMFIDAAKAASAQETQRSQDNSSLISLVLRALTKKMLILLRK